MSTEQIPAIDVHAHYGCYIRGGVDPRIEQFMTASAEEVVRRARKANIEWTIASPLRALLPRGGGDPIGGNDEAAATIANTDGMLQYVVVDPLTPATYEQAAEMLQRPKCVGIKIHPEEHQYPIVEHGRKIFEFAARHHAVVLTHSSEQNSQADDFVPFMNDYPEVKLILAHIGHGWDGDLSHQIRAIQRCRHENAFADTSSSRSITPGLIEWAVKEVGASRILFGSDTPLYHAPMQRRRIDHADLSDSDKRLILRDNAIKLFNLKLA